MADIDIVLTTKKLRVEAESYYSIVFDRPSEIIYNPGDWMDIRFPTPEFPVGKTYSFASSPTEPDLVITFKEGRSDFKRALVAVVPGDTMLITQYGSNGFLHDREHAAVFIAGGVGITPFRSMIKRAIDVTDHADIMLVYLNHTDDFPFKRELEDWQRRSYGVRVQYLVTGREGRLTKPHLQDLVPGLPDKQCYVAGPPGMVDHTKRLLLALGISETAMKTDSFDGY